MLLGVTHFSYGLFRMKAKLAFNSVSVFATHFELSQFFPPAAIQKSFLRRSILVLLGMQRLQSFDRRTRTREELESFVRLLN